MIFLISDDDRRLAFREHRLPGMPDDNNSSVRANLEWTKWTSVQRRFKIA